MLLNKKDVTFSIEASLFNLDKPKTKLLLANIEKLNISGREKVLVIMAKKSRKAYLAARNLSNIEIISADQLNLLSIIKTKYILIETDAVKIITEIYNG